MKLNKLKNIIKEELNRISLFLEKENIIVEEKQKTFLSKIKNKLKDKEKKINKDKIIEKTNTFLSFYIVFLSELLIINNNMDNKLIEMNENYLKEMEILNGKCFYINEKVLKLSKLIIKEEIESSDHRFIVFLLSKQIGCLNRTLNKSFKLFKFAIDINFELMDFVIDNNIDNIKKNKVWLNTYKIKEINDFFDENILIDTNVPLFYNLYDICDKINKIK